MKLTLSDAVGLLRRVVGPNLPSSMTMLLPPCARDGNLALNFAKLLNANNVAKVHCVVPGNFDHTDMVGLTHVSGKTPKCAARHAITSDHSVVILPENLADNAYAALTTRSGTLSPASDSAAGCEMLPGGALRFVRPLLTIAPTNTALDTQQLQNAPISWEDAVSHGNQRSAACSALHRSSDAMLRDCVVQASHWGYVVVRRRSLIHAYSDHSRRIAVHDCLARIMTHVSGSDDEISSGCEAVDRLSQELFADEDVPVPKGRTANGMVVRRATGRFARRLAGIDHQRRRRRRGYGNNDESNDSTPTEQEELMIFTREPDKLSKITAKRLGGNATSAPLHEGSPAYWDNRYVLFAHQHDAGTVTDKEILQSLVAAPDPSGSDLESAVMYARQLTRNDWERITAAIPERVKLFQVPFECIRALPGIFEKVPGALEAGTLAASPHLGLSCRTDLLFTAVRVPRFRNSLPHNVCPAFVLQEERDRRARRREENTRRRQHREQHRDHNKQRRYN